MSIFDHDKEYVLLRETKIISYGEISQRLDVVTFGDTIEELENLCNSMNFESGNPADYKSYTTITTNYYAAKSELLPVIFQTYYPESSSDIMHKIEKSPNDVPTCNPLRFILVGDELILKHQLYGDIPFIVIGRDHDAPDTITVLSRDIIQLMPFDAMEPFGCYNENIKRYGRNRYDLSNISQWLNSDATSGCWYKPMHKYDEGPSKPYVLGNPYDDLPGFLNGFTNDVKDLMVTVCKPYAYVDSLLGIGLHDIYQKVFLLSAEEIGLGDMYDGLSEGFAYNYFKGDDLSNRRIAKPSEYCVSHDTFCTGAIHADDGWGYWLRSGNPHHCYEESVVTSDGTLYHRVYAYRGTVGVRPAMVLRTK